MRYRPAFLFVMLAGSLFGISSIAIAKQEYKEVASFGATRTVYVSPEGLEDKDYIAGVLDKVVDKKEHQIIWLYDDLVNTPAGVPMTDQNILHWKAQYLFNPDETMERFTYIEVTDPKASPPKVRQIEAVIRPGYAEN